MDPRWYSWPLLPLGWGYGAVMGFRRIAFKQGWLPSYQAPVPVISIGNISMGGTGKTPLCEYILRMTASHQAAYLSRGYGRETKGYIFLNASTDSATKVGDEALQVAKKFPNRSIAVCESRKNGIYRLIEEHQAGAIVLDDAFQHLKVRRDLNILVIDANRLPMHDWIFPAGRLRESLLAIHDADLIVVNKVSTSDQLSRLKHKLKRFGKPLAFCSPYIEGIKSFDGQSWTWSDIRKQSVGAFAGIGNPTFFFSQLSEHVSLASTKSFRDHRPYRSSDLDMLANRQEVQAWITTEKDYVRLLHHPYWKNELPANWYYVPISLHWWEGEDLLQKSVKQVLATQKQ